MGIECVQYFNMYSLKNRRVLKLAKDCEWLLRCDCGPLQVIDEVKPVMRQPRSPSVQVQCGVYVASYLVLHHRYCRLQYE